MINKEFVALIRDITRSREFKQMKEYKHHVKGSVYDHSVKVAYLCYRHHKRFSMKIDIDEFVRGALLHDYYLYDLHGDGISHRFHWVRHPGFALQNALEKYPSLTATQQDMIKHHMFPITPMPPTTAAGWLICFYDKVAAISDRFGKNKWEAAQLYFKKRNKKMVYNIL